MSGKDGGYRLPTVIDPEGVRCVCVPIPNNQGHILAFLGQLDELGYWYTWERDDNQTGAAVARVWRGVAEYVRESLDMDCGCGGSGGRTTPTGQRYTDNGHLEVTYDGGATWEDGDGLDPRFNAPTMPKLTGGDVKCNSAMGAAQFMQDEIYSELDTGFAIAELIGLVAAVLAIVGTGGAATPLVVALSSSIVGFGVTASLAALTPEVWDAFACLVYCRMDEDGLMTSGNYDGLLIDIGEEFTGIAVDLLRYTVMAFGPVGITNAGRTERMTSADCSGCSCDWVEYFLGPYGQRDVLPTAWPTSNFCTGSYSGGKLVGCCGGNSTGNRIRASLNFDEANITRVIMHTETQAQSSSSDEQLIYNGLVEIITVGTPTGSATTVVDSGPIDIMSGELIFRVSAAMGSQTCAGTSSYARITMIEIHGTGFNPFE